ncbi:GNAT family N-acetyltransferase [Herbiconiux sp. A18JL235]|uniref:GNAT family N-acetyltransferase n=1 Tax=Herbiconiux sp. A18JL235 TaxID=3152363 RepID=A0AB39BDI5_9MICO
MSTTVPTPAHTVRPVRPHEFEAVGDLTRRAFAAGPYGHLPVSPERRMLERDTGSRLRSGTVLVAVDADERVVGSATLLRPGTPEARLAAEGEAEIRLLAVDPTLQRSGIGEQLVEASLAEARRWGSRFVVLDTGALNVKAQRLYLRAGFRRATDRAVSAYPNTHDLPHVYVYDLDDREGVRIRLARESEYEAIGELAVTANTHDYRLPQGYLDEIRDVAPRAREHEVWVAEDLATGVLLGTVATPRAGGLISELGREGELDFRLLAVAPDARGRGVGELLTRHVIALARSRGAERVVMNSGPVMLAAHRLYARLGFCRLPDRDIVITEDGAPLTLFTFGLDLDLGLDLD